MATTTNYSWTTPDNTAYVKDGASAIRSLGSSVDTSLFSITGGKNVGYQFINATSFTSAATIQVNNVFTSAYDNYVIVLRTLQNTTSGNFYYQNSLSGTPNASSYQGNGYSSFAAGLSAVLFTTSAGSTKAAIGSSSAGNVGQMILNVSSPALAVSTLISEDYMFQATGAGGATAGFIGIQHLVSTAFDGFTITTDAGTLTGTLRVYGLRNS